MSRFLLRLEEVLPEREHPLVGRPTVSAALIEGGSAPNVVPDRCIAQIDRRLIPGESDPNAVVAPFELLVASIAADHPEVDLSFDIREWVDAAEAPADSEIAGLARRSVAAETGTSAVDCGFTGITDARFYINDARIPAVILGPGSLSVAHAADEWIDLNELVTGARIYARMFASFLGS
jgi:acetylornithine deacetylase/succinyl-diaminopimelate desuccinylase-like protein